MDKVTATGQVAAPIRWRKSTRSQQQGQCVEVARGTGRHLVRDSKRPDGEVLLFDALAWRAFVAEVKAGRYDD